MDSEAPLETEMLPPPARREAVTSNCLMCRTKYILLHLAEGHGHHYVTGVLQGGGGYGAK